MAMRILTTVMGLVMAAGMAFGAPSETQPGSNQFRTAPPGRLDYRVLAGDCTGSQKHIVWTFTKGGQGIYSPVILLAPIDDFRDTFTPVVDTAAYAKFDVFGQRWPINYTDTLTGGGNIGGIIQNLVVVDHDGLKPDLIFSFYSGTISVDSDNDPFSPDDGELSKGVLLGHVHVTTSDYVDFADNAVATKRNIALAFHLPASTTIMSAVVMAFGPFTPLTASSFTFSADIVKR